MHARFPESPYSVPFDGRFSIGNCTSVPSVNEVPGKKELEKQLQACVARISDLQRKLYADDRFALLLVFQAMDAAGKDGTIRAVMSGVNPAGCQVSSFKAPSDKELEHDWLWRTTKQLPERGRIGIFNRSYYEEVLAVRVHAEYLENQRLPSHDHETFWDERYQSIRDHERHLSANGTVVLKFWLNVSKDEQRERFLKRLTTPEKYWKFSKSDLKTRGRWDEYMNAYEVLLNKTSSEHSPWYAVPADNKRYMRLTVARIIQETLESLPLSYPEKSDGDVALFEEYIAHLRGEVN